ncbi:hypothetical protein [Frankia sp. R43]|uniref:hypothetical protein n=1 Tax=Frankia sp. R43 TaxID=269536 RepID=UPI000AECBE8D|nr:hypothetical protein [Frankia sp. R43]
MSPSAPTPVPVRTTFADVLDPISGERRSVSLGGGRALDPQAPAGPNDRVVDGSGFWLLPAVYDADAHLPLLEVGLREVDVYVARHGGVSHQNVALQWQALRHLDLPGIVAELRQTVLPAITPLLSVNIDDTDDFAAWFDKHLPEVRDLLPPVCKLYTADPHFERHLDLVWSAGLRAVVYCYTEPDFDWLVTHVEGPLHVRHATSAGFVDRVLANAGATVQTSPHLLHPLAPGRREDLVVLPTPPDDAERTALADVFLDRVTMLATDHNALPVSGPTGPGLQAQQHLLPLLLSLCDVYGWTPAQLWPKITTAPTEVFGTVHPQGWVVVDPAHREQVSPWPMQAADRAAFVGLTLPGRVLAIGSGDHAELV